MHDYNTILGVIELRLSKVSYDAVQKRYKIGRSGIALIMNRYNDSGLSLDDLRQMPASKVVDLIYPKENLRHKDIPLPDFEKIHEQMIQMGKHADLSFLWIDYKKEHPNGYQLAQFYKLYRDFLVDTYGTSKTSMPVERIPGEKMYIDWVGDQPELLLDTTTGELRKVHIFTTNELCDTGKNQICIQSLFILSPAPCKTQIILDMVDISFHYSPDFIGIIPFFGFTDCPGISTKVLFRIYVYHATAFEESTRVFTKTLAMCFSSRFVIDPFHFWTDKLESWYTAS